MGKGKGMNHLRHWGVLGASLVALLAAAAPAAADTLAYKCANDICTVDPTAPGSHLNLSNSPADGEERPAWSPDGKSISFVANGAGGLSDVWVTPATLTGSATDVSATPTFNEQGYQAQWSPDSSTLAFTGEDYGSPPTPYPIKVLLVRADGTTLTPTILNSGAQASGPRWLSDGAHASFLAGGGKTFTQSSDGTGTPAQVDLDPVVSWSPDGTRYMTYNFSTHQIQVKRVDGTGTPVTVGTTASMIDIRTDLNVSQNWTKVAWIDFSAHKVDVANTDGTGSIVPIPSTTTGAINPALSSDGSQIAYAGTTGGPYQIYVGPSGGSSNATAVTSDAGGSMEPAWKPEPLTTPPPTTPGGGGGGGGGGTRVPIKVGFATNQPYNPFHLIVGINCRVDGFVNTDPPCATYGKGGYGGSTSSHRVVASLAKPKKTVTVLTAKKKTIAAGASGKLAFKVTKAGRKIFKPGKVVKVKLTVVVTSGSDKETVTKTVKLKAPRKKKH